ncbi:MAG: hypothetical protein K2P65_02835 [Lachnospiraceae bacterium]|nr:hypothetical protein [Lachnospiraceae bacterium]
MKPHETEKFQRIGSFFYLLLLICGVGIPAIISLIGSLTSDIGFRIDIFLGMTIVFAIIALFILLLLISWGNFSFFVKRTAKGIGALPYQFNSSFQSRGGNLYIDVENGMIAFISTYNPLKIQVFNASRIGKAETLASAFTGIRFVFYLDGKKISMPTLITNKMVSTKSGIGAEAVSKADTFVELLLAAKQNAGMGAGR